MPELREAFNVRQDLPAAAGPLLVPHSFTPAKSFVVLRGCTHAWYDLTDRCAVTSQTPLAARRQAKNSIT